MALGRSAGSHAVIGSYSRDTVQHWPSLLQARHVPFEHDTDPLPRICTCQRYSVNSHFRACAGTVSSTYLDPVRTSVSWL